MGLYKLCKHQKRERDRCDHAWWASFQWRGRRLRVSLARWAASSVDSKTNAQAVYDRLRAAIRQGRFSPGGEGVSSDPLSETFSTFADIYVQKHVKAVGLRGADTIEYRLGPLRKAFGPKRLSDISLSDVDAFVAGLRFPEKLSKHHKSVRTRKPSTINRYQALLRHMFNWAVARGYVLKTPFRREGVALIKLAVEDNRRHRRLSPAEELTVLEQAAPHVRSLIVLALDTGLRRGEMLALTWADLEARPGWLRVRGVTAKSKKTRWVPVGTARLSSVLDGLRNDASGQPKGPHIAVCSNEVGEPIRYFMTAWKAARRRAGLADFRWHDLRHEYASRLVERGVVLSQVRDLLGHASIVTTERYDNQRDEALFEAARLLDTPAAECQESVKSEPVTSMEAFDASDAKVLQELEEENGVGDGFRTRDFRIHNPALYP